MKLKVNVANLKILTSFGELQVRETRVNREPCVEGDREQQQRQQQVLELVSGEVISRLRP